MKLFLVSLFAVACLSVAHADEAVTIPLSDMWAYEDPAIQSTASIDPPADDAPLSQEIGITLNPASMQEKPKSAFIVTGSPSEALIKAHEVIVKKQPTQSEFATDEPLTLVFMSYSDFHMSLKPVELRKGNPNEIVVKYFVKMSGRGDAQEYFALIPLGKHQAGSYRVIVKQVPGTTDGRPNVPQPIIPRAVVSPGFSFEINQRS
jgi:hypothetical protein